MPTATPTPRRPAPDARTAPAVRPVPAVRAVPAARPVPAPAPAARKAPAPALNARTVSRGLSLPGWADLDGGVPGVARNGARAAAGQRKAAQLADRKADRQPDRAPAADRMRAFDAVPSLRFGLLVLLACLTGTLFVAHVYATRATLADLQDARRENEQLRLAGQRLRGEFDRMTGPDAVMPRAAALGLEEGVAYGVPIRLSAATAP